MTRLDALQLRRAALRLRIAETRSELAEHGVQLRSGVRTAAVAVSLVRLAAAISPRWRVLVLGAAGALVAAHIFRQRHD